MSTFAEIKPEQAIQIAQEFVSDHLPDLLGPGLPWRMQSPLGRVWVVPIWLAYPGFDQTATVGSIAIDEVTGQIISWTPFEELLVNARAFQEKNAPYIMQGLAHLQINAYPPA